MTPCVPPELQQQADKAERRKKEALERLIEKTGEAAPADPFLREMERLIDADKNVVRLLGKRKGR